MHSLKYGVPSTLLHLHPLDKGMDVLYSAYICYNYRGGHTVLCILGLDCFAAL